ncbi:MAG: hypothetical protein FWC96_04730 [Oscillospiraceae bacterium]|nr:hypothetical protein [Oscillospiraceae bacterium]
MRNNTKLILIKLLHTAIWCVMAAAVFYILHAGIFDRINLLVWFCVGLIFVETIVLLIFKWKCPLTLLGRKYTDNTGVGFDIFLPVWLAKNNKLIFSCLFTVGLVLVLWRVI